MNYSLMTLEELEKEQEKIHEKFEAAKEVCYNKWIEIKNLSEQFKAIEEEIKKRNGQ